ncbi:glutamate--tRNA ligase [Patescibacteria group bacterium]|nr:glutamate--tRNA ligase [Patescibacteria group bacterium]
MKNPFNEHVRVRFAPSPTGFLHIGNLRTALYNELLARHFNGDFILRIEDTDRTRIVEGGVENICRSLQATGIIPNEGIWLDEKGELFERGDYGPYLQSACRERHLEQAEKLVTMDKAYYCFCSTEHLDDLRKKQQAKKQPTMYDGSCRKLDPTEARKKVESGESHVIRLKLPKHGLISFNDIIRGKVTFDWSVIDDQVIIKSDGFPTYHLAATSDDNHMAISHVLRGEEWVSSTPKHLFIYEAFGWKIPQFAHLPLLLNKDKSKLSKRQSDVATEDYLKNGYLPEALLNFVALLGWNPSAEREIYSHDELVELFSVEKINHSGAVFNLEKLDWLNSQYIKQLPKKKYLKLARTYLETAITDDAYIDRCLLMLSDRIVRFGNVTDLAKDFLDLKKDYSGVSLTWKKQTTEDATEKLEALKELLESLSADDVAKMEKSESAIKSLILERGWTNGETLWPLRVALSGQEKSPSPFELLAIYGKDRSLGLLENALKHLRAS